MAVRHCCFISKFPSSNVNPGRTPPARFMIHLGQRRVGEMLSLFFFFCFF